MIREFLLMVAVVAIAGCSTVSSYRVSGAGAQQPSSDNAGSYFLAKHVLKVTVTNDLISVASVAVADRSALFQVGFNLSPLAEDDIKIEYNKDGLLKALTSVNEDKTGEILKQVATTVGTFRSTGTGQKVKVSEFTFDPFNADEARNVNSLLARAIGPGTCVSVELFDNVWSPGCNVNPFQHSATSAYAEPEPMNINKILKPVEPGIYYRRPLDHRVFVAHGGTAFETKILKFANYAPVMRLDATRTMFVKRETTIMFDDNGALQSVQVKKPSEALAIATLPATLLGAYIDAIVQGFTREKDVQSARANLLKQQAETLQAERKLLEAIAQGGEGSAGAARALSLSRSTGFGFRSEAADHNSDLEQAYRNIAACQSALGESVESCTSHVQRMTAIGLE
ncbi:hypothetical protein [Rhizobium leguminosarum]|uniref:hypothetical protein n=1 Tax=Rhizobium leguminosarum TaxID=384 RepID=UPI003F956295